MVSSQLSVVREPRKGRKLVAQGERQRALGSVHINDRALEEGGRYDRLQPVAKGLTADWTEKTDTDGKEIYGFEFWKSRCVKMVTQKAKIGNYGFEFC